MTLKRLLLAAAVVLAVAPAWAAVQGQSIPARPPGPPTSPEPGASGGVRRNTGTLNRSDGTEEGRSDGTTDSWLRGRSTRTLKGEVVEVNPMMNSIVVAIAPWERRVFYVYEETKLRADRETTLGGKKKLTLRDFQKGQIVKVTYWTEEALDWTVSFHASEVRARKAKD